MVYLRRSLTMNGFRKFARGRFVDDERGVVIIIVAVVMVIALAFLALVVDLGNGRRPAGRRRGPEAFRRSPRFAAGGPRIPTQHEPAGR